MFTRLMIELDEQEANYLSICKHYRAILSTPKIKDDESERKAVMKNVALFVVLAPYDNEQSDLIHRILEDKILTEVPLYKLVNFYDFRWNKLKIRNFNKSHYYFRDLLNLFVNPELIRWSGLCNTFEKELKVGSPNSGPTKVFAAEVELGGKRWSDLKKRVVEHVSSKS